MAATLTSIDMYNLLREKIGDQQAKSLTDYVEQRIDQSFEKEKSGLATKIDMAELREGLRVEMMEQKSEIIKWMFIFWIGQIGATIGVILIKH
jgi:hypothetical protein